MLQWWCSTGMHWHVSGEQDRVMQDDDAFVLQQCMVVMHGSAAGCTSVQSYMKVVFL